MPQFLVQKMDNLCKRWNDLEATPNNSNNNNNGLLDHETFTFSATNKKRCSTPPNTLDVSSQQQQQPINNNNGSGSISSSSPSSPPRYSDEITPVRDHDAHSLDLIAIVKTTTKINTTETITTEENRSTTEEKVLTVKKTPSIDSIKSKTIVTPFELEPNNADDYRTIAKDLNIIKLENEAQLTSVLLNEAGTNELTTTTNRALLDITSPVSSTLVEESRAIRDESKDDIDLISNDLFDWLLWIDHTLESQLVTVGDQDEINQAIQKYDVSLMPCVLKRTSFYFYDINRVMIENMYVSL